MQAESYIAFTEKAFLDQLYLQSRGKASLDLDELNLKGLSPKSAWERF
jgi:hypothetical protein